MTREGLNAKKEKLRLEPCCVIVLPRRVRSPECILPTPDALDRGAVTTVFLTYRMRRVPVYTGRAPVTWTAYVQPPPYTFYPAGTRSYTIFKYTVIIIIPVIGIIILYYNRRVRLTYLGNRYRRRPASKSLTISVHVSRRRAVTVYYVYYQYNSSRTSI